MSSRNHAGRAAEYEARDHLRDLGFECVRCSDECIDLIAWKKDRIIALKILRSRITPKAANLRPYITKLAEYLRNGRSPGALQLWVRFNDSWHRYRIFIEGASLISGDVFL